MNIKKNYIVIFFTFFVSALNLVNAQSRKTVSTFEECERCDANSGQGGRKGYIYERNYMACIALNVPVTLKRECKRLLFQANSNRNKSKESKYTALERFVLLRKAKQNAYLAYFAARFALDNDKISNDFQSYFTNRKKEALLIVNWIDEDMLELASLYPKVKRQILNEIKEDSTGCGIILNNLLKKVYVEVDPVDFLKENYTSVVIPCAEFKISFFSILKKDSYQDLKKTTEKKKSSSVRKIPLVVSPPKN